MSSKLPAPALAALLLTLVASAPEPAFAKRPATPHHVYKQGYGRSHGEYGYLYQPQIHDSSGGLAPGAGAPPAFPPPVHRPGPAFQTDPDPHIRFEMNRDDFDRRMGGS